MSGSGPTVVGLFTDQGRARDFQSCYQDQAQIFVVELADVGVEEMDGGDR